MRWTPAQVACLAFGLWWTSNGLAVLLFGDSSLSTPAKHGHVGFLGLSIGVNGWHGLFHLSTGLAGVAVCRWARAAWAYAVASGTLYLAAALTGLITHDDALGVIFVDTLGTVVHAGEGLVILLAALASAPMRGQMSSRRRPREEMT